jgi:hypothetical protein
MCRVDPVAGCPLLEPEDRPCLRIGERMGPNRWTLPGGALLLIPARNVDSATIREIRRPEPDRS